MGNTSGQYTMSLGTFHKDLGSGAAIFNFTNSTICAKYWNVRTNNGTSQIFVYEISFNAQSCPAGYYLYGNVACLPCDSGTYGAGGWTGSNCTACSAGTYATGTGGSLFPSLCFYLALNLFVFTFLPPRLSLPRSRTRSSQLSARKVG